ncbi:MAG: hydrogenase nickel incorporation protein HypB [Natronomonas sp.]
MTDPHQTFNRRLDALLESLRPTELLEPLRTHRFTRQTDEETEESNPHGDVLAAIEREAAAVHERVAHDHGVFAVEFLGATGSGKTALVERLLERRPDDETVAVVVGDVAGDDDARRYRNHGVRAVDVTTGKDCHLDPTRVGDAVDRLDLESLDTLIVENVGNMVCPADFPIGATIRVVVVSVTEGDDVVRKHPLLFQASDLAVINKTDIADAVGADVERMCADIRRIDPELPVLTTSAETEAGIGALETHLWETKRDQHPSTNAGKHRG